MIRTAVIGYGLGGMAFHAPLVDAVPELELAAIATSRAEEVQARYPGMAVVTPEAAIADPGIALIVISTPNASHAPLAKAALLAGKHVVIDKPFAVTSAEAEELIALAESRGLVLGAFHNRRWDGDFLTVQRVLASGRIGELSTLEMRWDRYRPDVPDRWRESADEPGAGLLFDLGPHMIDQTLVLLGQPDAISADIAVQREGGQVDDWFQLTLHYGERRAILSAGCLALAAGPRFTLHGRLGSFVKYGLDPQEGQLKSGANANDPGHGVEDAAQHGTLSLGDGTVERLVTEAGDYRRYYSGVGQAIANGGPPPVPAQDALTGLRLIELARQSAESGRRLTV